MVLVMSQQAGHRVQGLEVTGKARAIAGGQVLPGEASVSHLQNRFRALWTDCTRVLYSPARRRTLGSEAMRADQMSERSRQRQPPSSGSS